MATTTAPEPLVPAAARLDTWKCTRGHVRSLRDADLQCGKEYNENADCGDSDSPDFCEPVWVVCTEKRAHIPGSWRCDACGTPKLNFPEERQCHVCRAHRPSPVDMVVAAMPARPGDWECPACGVNNYASNRQCFKTRCAEPRPASAGGSGGDNDRERDRAPARAPIAAKAGDWTCTHCDANNFARNTSCFRSACGKPRGAGDASAPPPGKAGGWDCAHCGADNFARNTACWRRACGKPRGPR